MMTMQNWTVLAAVSLAVTSGWVAPAAAQGGPPQYTVTVVGSNVFPTAMSPAGVVGGHHSDPSTGAMAAHVWQNGASAMYPWSLGVWGWGVNDSGVIVGDRTWPAHQPQMFIADPVQGMRALNVFGNARGIAHGINNTGQVVGSAWHEGNQRYEGFLWRNGIATSLPGPAGNEGGGGVAVSASGMIAGAVAVGGQGVPTVWSAGGYELLALPAGYSRGNARRLTENGLVVGSVYEGPTSKSRAVLWGGGAPVLLPDFGESSFPMGINSAGQIVGYAGEPGTGSTAVLWWEGNVFRLEDLVQSAEPVSLGGAAGIDEMGRIVAYGSIGKSWGVAVLLTPIPGPGSMLVVAAGLMLGMRRRR